MSMGDNFESQKVQNAVVPLQAADPPVFDSATGILFAVDVKSATLCLLPGHLHCRQHTYLSLQKLLI